MPMFWSRKRTTVEWLAAQYRDMMMMNPGEAMRKAQEDYDADPDDAAKRAESFRGMVQGMTGVDDPRRVGNWGR